MKLTKVYKRNGDLAPFSQKRITDAIYKSAASVGGHDMKVTMRLSDAVMDVLKNHFPKNIPTIEDIQDIVEKVLVEEGHAKTAKAYILYRQKRQELREKREREEIENIPYKIIWQALVWSLKHNCETVDKLNAHIRGGTFLKLIKAAEKKYNDEILDVASLIEEDRKRVKLLIITGPSSSGKTTTTNRLSKKLESKGVEFVKLNIDNYFYNLKDHLEDDYGDHDFEGPYALDLPLINRHLTGLLAGKKIKVPRYNFKTGRREKETDILQVNPRQVILIDSHFGIYDKLTESVPRDRKFKLYLETLCQLIDKNGRFVRWTDIRMLRRMIRDSQFRAYKPAQTVGHWHYVRRGETKNIIPYISTADYILNTSLAYELPILKYHLFKYFPSIVKTYQKDSGRKDAAIRAERVYNLLKTIQQWKNDDAVPKNSILREFIG